MENKKVWTPNPTQAKFIETLSDKELTLAEASEIAGVEFKSGSLNTLTAKGIVEVCGEREVIVQAKRKVKVYRLVK